MISVFANLKERAAARKAGKGSAQEHYEPKHPSLIMIEKEKGRIGIAVNTDRVREATTAVLKNVMIATEYVQAYANSASKGIGVLTFGKKLRIETDMMPSTETDVPVDYNYMDAKMNADEVVVLRHLASNGRADIAVLAETNGMSRRDAFNSARLLVKRGLAELNGETAAYAITENGIKALSYYASAEYRLNEDKMARSMAAAATTREDDRSTAWSATEEASGKTNDSFLRRERMEKVVAFSITKDEGV